MVINTELLKKFKEGHVQIHVKDHSVKTNKKLLLILNTIGHDNKFRSTKDDLTGFWYRYENDQGIYNLIKVYNFHIYLPKYQLDDFFTIKNIQLWL